MTSPKHDTTLTMLGQACTATEDTLNDVEFAETALSTIKFVVKQLPADDSLLPETKAKIHLINDNLVLATYFTCKASNELDFIRADWVAQVDKAKAGAA